jgi:hypothetical protein
MGNEWSWLERKKVDLLGQLARAAELRYPA